MCDTANALILEDGAVIGVKCEENTYYADSVIICCGGKSYPLTGSTGDGYTLAKTGRTHNRSAQTVARAVYFR